MLLVFMLSDGYKAHFQLVITMTCLISNDL